MKKPDIAIFCYGQPTTAAGMHVGVRLDEAACVCPACIGQVIGQLLLRAHTENENRTPITGHHHTFTDYVGAAMHMASLHVADVHADRAAEEAAAADVGQGDDAPTPAEDAAPPNSDPWARPPDVAIHAMVQGTGRVMACKIGNSAPIDVGSVGAYCAVLLQTAYTCSNGEAEPFDVFCANVLGQMHRALMRHTRLDPDAPEN